MSNSPGTGILQGQQEHAPDYRAGQANLAVTTDFGLFPHQ